MSRTSCASSPNLLVAPIALVAPVAPVSPAAPALGPVAIVTPAAPVMPIAPTAIISITMSDSDSVSLGLYCSLPVFSRNNFGNWKIQIIAYLTGVTDHVHVISRHPNAASVIVDPAHPTDDTEAAKWDASECMALGVIMSTASKLHGKIILAYCEAATPVFELWEKIGSLHQLHDALLHHQAWLQFFSTCKTSDESYTELSGCVEGLWVKIDCLTPINQTRAEHGAELKLLGCLFALPFDDHVRQSLTMQLGLTLEQVQEAFVCVDTGVKLHLAGADSANAARTANCWTCNMPGHFSHECPHPRAIKDLLNKHVAASRSGNHTRCGGKPHSAPATNPAAISVPNPTSANIAVVSEESSSVATLFFTGPSYLADNWVCDTGASSSMTSHRSFFLMFRGDRCPIRLADGMIVYSEGISSIRFLSTHGFCIVIDDVLYVPRLSTNLFLSNKFAGEHREKYREILDYPTWSWVNRQTGVVEFLVTIHHDNLAYLDWRVKLHMESACVSLEDLHMRFNHMPYRALRRLVRDGSIDGIPDRITEMHRVDDFCEDCMAGKLTCAPHMNPAMCAERPLDWVYTDMHGPVPTKSCCGNCYWVSFVDDHSRFPAVYFISKKSDVFGAFRCYRAWAENIAGRRIGILRDNKGGEYTSAEMDQYLMDAGIHCEHSIRNTPQQLGVAERLNRTLDEGITTLLAQSSLSHTWWEDAALHFLYRRMRLPSAATSPSTSHNLFYGKKGSIEWLRPFGCLVYVHLQKDQHSIFQSHPAQCVLIGYPTDYKGWHFWDPTARREVISDSAVFRESVFPFRQPSLSAIDRHTDANPPAVSDPPVPDLMFLHRLLDDRMDAQQIPLADPPLNDHPPLIPPPRADAQAPCLVLHILQPQPPDIPKRPQMPPEVRNLLSNFEHHPLTKPLPLVCLTCTCVPGALLEDTNSAMSSVVVHVPLLDTIEFIFSTTTEMEPRSLVEALKHPDVAEWVKAALSEIKAHVQNGTWELAQLPPGRRAIRSRWVFKIKRTPDGAINKYKGRLVVQGFSQIPGVHYGEVFASTAQFAVVRTVMALAVAEDLELEAVDISTAFLNGDIDTELYMRIPEGFKVKGKPHEDEDPKRWVVRLLKGLYGIKQGPCLWVLKLHSVLTMLGFQRIDCNYSVYVYLHDSVKIFMPVYVDDLLVALNSKSAIQQVKRDLATHFTIHNQGPVRSILSIKVVRD